MTAAVLSTKGSAGAASMVIASLAAVLFSSAGCGLQTIEPTPRVGPPEVDRPVEWFPLNDPMAIGRDHSGNGRDALVLGVVLVPDTVRGYAARMDAGSLAVLPAISRTLSVTLWVKTTVSGPDQTGWINGPRIVDADIGGLHSDFGLGLALDRLAVGIGVPDDSNADNMSLKSQRAVVDGTWHHVGITRNGDSGMWQLFVDGVLDGSKTSGAGDLMLPKTIALGGTGNSTPASPQLKADLSDVRFYDRVLSAAAIAFLATR
jgi:hypothetical protein